MTDTPAAVATEAPPSFTPEEVSQLVKTPEFQGQPPEERQYAAEEMLASAHQHLGGLGEWTPERQQAWGDFAKEIHGHAEQGWGEWAVGALKHIPEGVVSMAKDASVAAASGLDYLFEGGSDSSIADEQRKAGTFVPQSLGQAFGQAEDSNIRRMAGKVQQTVMPPDDNARAVLKLQTEVDQGLVPLHDEAAMKAWLGGHLQDLPGLGNPGVGEALVKYVTTRSPRAWATIAELSKNPMRQQADQQMQAAIDSPGAELLPESMRGNLASASDPLMQAAAVVPFVRGAQAVGAIGALGKAAQVGKSMAEMGTLGAATHLRDAADPGFKDTLQAAGETAVFGGVLSGIHLGVGKGLEALSREPVMIDGVMRDPVEAMPGVNDAVSSPPNPATDPIPGSVRDVPVRQTDPLVEAASTEPADGSPATPVQPPPEAALPSPASTSETSGTVAQPVTTRNAMAPEPLPGRDQAPYEGETSTRNAVVDAERVARGLEPIMAPLRREWGTAWDEASQELSRNENAAANLVEQINDKPRSLSDTENAMLLQHKIGVQEQIRRTVETLNDPAADAGAQASARLALAQHNAALDAVDNAGKAAGTHMGRGLNARKMWGGDADFYDLPAMLAREQAMKGEALTPAEIGEVQARNSKITAARAALEAHESKVAEERTVEGANALHEELQQEEQQWQTEAPAAVVKETIKTLATQREEAMARIRQRAEAAEGNVAEAPVSQGVLALLSNAAEQAKARQSARRGRLHADPLGVMLAADLADSAIIGAYHVANGAVKFADWSREMIKDFGDRIRPHLQDLWQASRQHVMETHATVTEKVQQGRQPATPERVLNQAMIKGKLDRETILAMARSHITAGVPDLPQLLLRIHADASRVEPGITVREIQDTLSNYGKSTQPSRKAIEIQLAEMKSQARLTSALEDAQAGEAPKRTGFQRGKPSDKVRALATAVKDTMRKMGIETTSKESQLASALDGVKSRLRNQIADLEKQLATGEKTLKRPGIAYDEAANQLKARRDALRAQLEAIEGPSVMTSEQRLKAAMNGAQRSLDELNRRIKEKDFAPRAKGEPLPENARLNELRKARDEARDQYETLKDLDPAAKLEAEKIALRALKRRLATNERNLRQRLATNDFSKRKPREIKYDEEADRLQARYNQAKLEYRQAVMKKQLSERSTQRIIGDTLVKWQRGFLLSGVSTLAKLSTAALYRLASTPLEEVVNSGLAKVLPGVAARAERNTGLNLKAEAKALTEGFVKGVKQFGQVVKTGKSDLDLNYGKVLGHDLDKSVLDYFGHLHGALKNPVKQAEFSRSYQKRMQRAIERGEDGTQPIVQMRVAKDAYADANRAIFMQPSSVSEGLNSLFGRLEGTKTNPNLSYWAAKVGRSIFPIVKIGTNYVAETANYVYGLPRSAVELTMAMRRGLHTLEPAEADAIMRHFTKGSVGAGMMLLGFFSPNSVGGYYTEGEKRRANDVKAGTFKVFGANVPHLLAHAPIIEAMQFGATMRRVMDHMNTQGVAHRKTPAAEGLLSSQWAATLGLLKEVPLLRGADTVGELLQGDVRGDVARRRLAKSFVVPTLLQETANLFDMGHGRKTKTLGEEIQSGIPGLRNQLPPKPLKH